MKRLLVAGVCISLGACGQEMPGELPAGNAGSDLPAQPANDPMPAPPPQPAANHVRETVSETPFTETSAQGAANVVQTYYALIEARRFADAHKLWSPGADDLADGTFADQFARYREYHAEVLAPGEIEGAAGSLYVDVPVRTYGVTTKGERFDEPAVVTLRRVNDVDGSTAEQRRWHIARISKPPQPH